jgi:replicative DNA helicase
MENLLAIKIQAIISKCADDEDLLFQLKKLVYENDLKTGTIRDSKSIYELYAENLSRALGPAENDHIIKSGFTDLDNVMGGFLPGEFVVIGGRPGMGVTQLQMNLALNISKAVPVQFFTYDFSANNLTNRFMVTLSGIETYKIRQHELTEDEQKKLTSLDSEMASRKLFINDSCSNSITALKKHCLEQIKDHGIKVIFVDYIQKMSSNRYRNNREQEVSYISKELKDLARDNDVCVIASSQLSRQVESRHGSSRKPQLTDLRDSGAIEQDADKVIFLYRPEYYGILEDEDGNSTAKKANLIIAKNRSGACYDVWITSNRNFTSFIDFDGFKNDFSFAPSRLTELENPSF